VIPGLAEQDFFHEKRTQGVKLPQPQFLLAARALRLEIALVEV
jgi:hypothetical protein